MSKCRSYDALADMRAGRSVLIVASGALAARELFLDLADEVGEGVAATRTNGCEMLRHERSGGSIRFVSVRRSVRGLTVDTVYVADLLPAKTRLELMVATATSEAPRLVRA